MGLKLHNSLSEKRTKVHDDSYMPPCQIACPLHMDIRGYVDLVAQGRIMEALQVIRMDNPFPSVCAYVCTHPCEEQCRRGQVDKPVAVRSLKRFAVEFGGDRMIQAEAETTHVEKVAIIGSGPAGMSCAYYLRKLGYNATIFEAHSEIGGMLRVGIPRYRLPQEVLDIEVQRLKQMGVEIRMNTRVVSLDLLFDMGYKAIFITIGAHQSLKLGIEGEDLPGMLDGATFLREVNLGLKPDIGKKVAVVGGGNVAIDAARTALRLGAQKISILYRRTLDEMPADKSEIQQAKEEGIDFRFLVSPVRIRRKNGKLVTTCMRMQLGEADASGRRKPVLVEGSDFSRLYDTVVMAIGQAPQLPEDFKLRIGRGSTIQVDPVTHNTNRMGVFAGGDAVTGPATVTEALAAGRRVAYRIDDFLQHRYPVPLKDTAKKLEGKLLPKTVDMIRKIGRLEPPILPPEGRLKQFTPVELVYDWEAAVNEARRCLRCGMGAEILFQDKCATCLTCLRICPYHVPYIDGNGIVQIPVDQCQACGICVGECPAKAIVLRKDRDRIQVAGELEHVLESALETRARPLIVGFCCQYGLYGTGRLANLWREARAGIGIVPVLCIAKVESEYILRALEKGADGVFLAGCGEQCSREDTTIWARQKVERARKVLKQIGLEPERVQVFAMNSSDRDYSTQLDEFVTSIGSLYLASTIGEEVKK